jgi:hypothetical protein
MDTRIEKENLEGCMGQISEPTLWGRCLFEMQAARFYTRSVFFKFQELLRDSTSCKKGQVTIEAEGVSIEILKQVRKCGQLTWKTYNVSVQDNATTYSCSCNMFEQDGLLCPHILKVFTSCDVEQIPEKYLLKRWSEEATIKISENPLTPEACFGVPTTNKLRYNALCRKMSGLAADACFAPEKYKIASEGIDKVWKDVKATGNAATIEQLDECQEQSTVNAAMVKNPPAKDRQGRPKNKVEKEKSIVQQAKEKAKKKSKSKMTKGSKKPPPCSYCHEDGHGVQSCQYMQSTQEILKSMKQTELKL